MNESPSIDRRSIAPGLALVSAVLFGVSMPIAKVLGDGINAWLLAGLLYLGSGIGLAVWRWARTTPGNAPKESPLARADAPWMAAVVFFGGVAGPLLLMFGLKATAGSTASLLLNLESLATMAIAWFVYRENVDRRLLLGAAAILAGAVVLSWDFSTVAWSGGAGLIAAACLCWGIDNNLTRKLSAADPAQIATIKGLAAGATNTTLGLWIAGEAPSVGSVAAIGLLGLAAYGVSLVLFVHALRALGAARTGAYFSTAPFAGALLSMPILGEPLTFALAAAAALMGLGVWLHLTERHEHLHEHEPLTHAHAHVHDEHHNHVHGPGDPLGEPHAHVHTHAALRHKHPHYPDLHHRHGH